MDRAHASDDDGVPRIRLVPLGPEHAAAILAGQDAAYAREVAGRRWDERALAAFCERSARWTREGPLRELVALDESGGVVGGGGVHRVGAGLERGEADLSYWVLAAHRGRGLGHAVAGELLASARADPSIRRAVLRIAPDNAASQAIARHLGAAPTGTSERHPADATRRVERWVRDFR